MMEIDLNKFYNGNYDFVHFLDAAKILMPDIVKQNHCKKSKVLQVCKISFNSAIQKSENAFKPKHMPENVLVDLDNMIDQHIALFSDEKPDKQTILIEKMKESGLYNNYIFIKDGNARQIWKINKRSIKNKVFELIPLFDVSLLEENIMSDLQSLNKALAITKNVQMIGDYMKIDAESFKKFKNYKIKHVVENRPHERPVFAKLVIPPIEPQSNMNNCPAWQEGVSRMSDSEAFCTWLWLVFEPENANRQLLYLYGEGETGKSKMLDVIRDRFSGLNIEKTSMAKLSAGERFGTANLFGKRLLFLDELADRTKLMANQNVKSITGGDSMIIEYKFGGSYTVNFGAKIIASSNHFPYIENEIHEKSRYLFIKMIKTAEKKDGEWSKRLYDQFWDFLGYCKHIFEKKFNKQTHRVDSKSSETYINQIILDSHVPYIDDLVTMFDFSLEHLDDWFIPRAKFRSELKERGIRSNNEINQCKKSLRALGFDDFKTERGHRKNGIPGFRGVKLKYDYKTEEISEIMKKKIASLEDDKNE